MILKPRISGDIPYKRKWELFGAIIGIALGYPLYLIISVIPDYSTDGIYIALTMVFPDLLANIGQNYAIIPYLIRGSLESINDVSITNPYYPITFFFISFLEFPCCISWSPSCTVNNDYIYHWSHRLLPLTIYSRIYPK